MQMQSILSCRPSHARRSGQPGFTLVEMLVAAVIMSVGLVGLVNTWVYMMSISIETDDRAAAYEAARSVIERARAIGYVQPVENVAYENLLPPTQSQPLSAQEATTALVENYRYFSRDLIEKSASSSFQTPGADIRYVAVTQVQPTTETNYPPIDKRPDLHLMTIDVKVYRVDAAAPAQTLNSAPLYAIQTCLANGGV